MNCGLVLTRFRVDGDSVVALAPEQAVEEETKPRRLKWRPRKKTVKAEWVAPTTDDALPQPPDIGSKLYGPQPVADMSPVAAQPVTSQTALAPVTTFHVATAPVPPAVTTQGYDTDESLEATVVHVATPATVSQWTLELATGTHLVLPGDDIVVGRHPQATDGATPVVLPDPTRSVSRTHARLRRDPGRDMWTIEDLGSGNGVKTYDSVTKTLTAATPGQPMVATEYLVIGDLEARLYRSEAVRHPETTSGVA